MARFNERGEHIPDPRRVEWPTELRRPPSLQDEIKRFIRQELSSVARDQGVETFEEADDFDTEEDPDLLLPTAYELTEEQLHRDASDLSRPEPTATPLTAPAEGGAPARPEDGRGGLSGPAKSVPDPGVVPTPTPKGSDAS